MYVCMYVCMYVFVYIRVLIPSWFFYYSSFLASLFYILYVHYLKFHACVHMTTTRLGSELPAIEPALPIRIAAGHRLGERLGGRWQVPVGLPRSGRRRLRRPARRRQGAPGVRLLEHPGRRTALPTETGRARVDGRGTQQVLTHSKGTTAAAAVAVTVAGGRRKVTRLLNQLKIFSF